ncbi:unnamed protein product, partial [Musa acuminata subsp. burmannicoides]
IFYPSRNIIVAILGLYNKPWHELECLRRRLENIRRNDEMMASLMLGRKVFRPRRHPQAHPLRH